jgi:hypothetical protein
MKRTLVRYRTKADKASENERLIRDVFRELAAKSPAGVRYMALRLDDDSFIHFVELDASDPANPLLGLEAFQAFQAGIRDRCIEPPALSEATIVGNYRMLTE